MLVLGIKQHEEICIGDDIVIRFHGVYHRMGESSPKICISAPKEIKIERRPRTDANDENPNYRQ